MDQEFIISLSFYLNYFIGDENQHSRDSNQLESKKLLEYERLKRQLVNIFNEQKATRCISYEYMWLTLHL